MGAECEAVREVVAGILEGAVPSPHVEGCGACGAAVAAERATRDRIRGAVPSLVSAAVPRRARGRFPAAGFAAAVLLGVISWLAPLTAGGPGTAATRRAVAPGRSEPEWSLLRAENSTLGGPFAARRARELAISEELR